MTVYKLTRSHIAVYIIDIWLFNNIKEHQEKCDMLLFNSKRYLYSLNSKTVLPRDLSSLDKKTIKIKLSYAYSNSLEFPMNLYLTIENNQFLPG